MATKKSKNYGKEKPQQALYSESAGKSDDAAGFLTEAEEHIEKVLSGFQETAEELLQPEAVPSQSQSSPEPKSSRVNPAARVFTFSSDAEILARKARELANSSERPAVTSSCILFAFAELGGAQSDICSFVRDALNKSGRYAEAFQEFQMDANTPGAVVATQTALGLVSTNVNMILSNATRFARLVSPHSDEIHEHHLWAAFIATPDFQDLPVAHERLKEMGLDLVELRSEFREYIRHSIPNENPGAWDTILGKGGRQQNMPRGDAVTGDQDVPLNRITNLKISQSTRALLKMAQSIASEGIPGKAVTSTTLLLAMAQIDENSSVFSFFKDNILKLKADLFNKKRGEYFQRRSPQQPPPRYQLQVPEVVTPTVQRLFEKAGKYRVRAGSDEVIAMRHLFAAILTYPETGVQPGCVTFLSELTLDLAQLRKEFSDLLQKSNPEESRVWRGILLPPAQKLLSYNTDQPGAGDEDCLGQMEHVKAMASLISSKALTPPLSIGLFGNWGSGKSFFMEKLRGKVREICGKAGPRKVYEHDYWQNIVQIEFNAWHYVDANLWASLVSHIFDELNKLGKSNGSEMQQATANALNNLKVSQEAQAEAQARLDQATKIVDEAKKTFNRRIEKFNTGKGRLANAIKISVWDSVRGSVSLNEDTKGHLKEIGIEVTELNESAAQVYARLNELGTLGGQTEAIWLAMLKGKGLKDALMLSGGVILVTAIVLLVPLNQWISAWISHGMEIFVSIVGPAIAIITGALKWINTNAKTVSNAMKPLREFQANIEKHLKKAEKDKAQKIALIENDLERAKAACTEATRRLDEANSKLSAAKAEVKEAKSGRLITKFIEQRASSGDYRKHLGIVSLIRDDFGELSRMVGDYNASLLELSAPPEENGGKEKPENLGVNRIILYIDDLDRCPADRVVEVLQAIHLLLAFKLFVVVVGVDSRWVSFSLQNQYDKMLVDVRANGSPAGSTGFLPDAASPRDYLEKIFQVPFWIREMRDDSCRSLINALVAGDREKEVAKAPPRPIELDIDRDKSGPVDPLRPTPGGDNPPSVPPAPGVPKPPPKTESPDIRAESLQLNKDEIGAMHELAWIIGRSPRATKYFINVYRLIKASKTAEDLDAFLANNSEFKPYRCLMLLLAVVTGMPMSSMGILKAIAHPRESESTFSSIEKLFTPAKLDESGRLKAFLVSDEKGKWRKIPLEQLKPFLGDVALYSFDSMTYQCVDWTV